MSQGHPTRFRPESKRRRGFSRGRGRSLTCAGQAGKLWFSKELRDEPFPAAATLVHFARGHGCRFRLTGPFRSFRVRCPRPPSTSTRSAAARPTATAEMKELLGGKGANLAEMSVDRHPRPARLHHHHRGLRRLLRATARSSPRRPSRRSTSRHQEGRGHVRQEVRRPGRPAARLRPLRRGPVDAGHDEHDPQPRPDRRLASRGWPRRPATPGSPTTATAALIDMFGSTAMGVEHEALRARAPHAQGREGGQARHRPLRRRPQGTGQAVQGRLQEARRRATSRRTRRSSSCSAINAVFN